MPMPEPVVDITNRESLIVWLMWNDPNGCYSDEDCILEGLPTMSLVDARNAYIDQTEGEWS